MCARLCNPGLHRDAQGGRGGRKLKPTARCSFHRLYTLDHKITYVYDDIFWRRPIHFYLPKASFLTIKVDGAQNYIAMIKRHKRQTYNVNGEWMFEYTRKAHWDIKNMSQVWFDFAERWNAREIANEMETTSPLSLTPIVARCGARASHSGAHANSLADALCFKNSLNSIKLSS